MTPELVSAVVDQLSSMLKTFKKQSKYKFFASSVLISYDAEAIRKFGTAEKIPRSKLVESVSVWLIDFAHVFRSDAELDENFVFGLENLLELFKNCVKK